MENTTKTTITKEEYLKIKTSHSTKWIEQFDAICYEIENISKLYTTLKPSEYKNMVLNWVKFLPLTQLHTDVEIMQKRKLLNDIAEKEIKPQKEVIYEILSIPQDK